jgi:hypothetical protein
MIDQFFQFSDLITHNSRFRCERHENSYSENKSLVQNSNWEWSLCFGSLST